jgi:hypothetical protein
LETGKIVVPVDAELFNVGFSSSSNDLHLTGSLSLHDRCLKWSIDEPAKVQDYEYVCSIVSNAAKRVRSIQSIVYEVIFHF